MEACSPGSEARPDGRDIAAVGEAEPQAVWEDAGRAEPQSLWVMGRLGDSEGRGADAELAPRRVDALGHASVRQASVGPFHAAVVTRGGDVYAWGANFFGQLGRPNEVGVGENSSTEMAQKFEDIGGVVVDAMDITVHIGAAAAFPPRPLGPEAHGLSGSDEAQVSVAVPACVRALALVKAYSGHTVCRVSCGGAHTITVCDQGIALVFGCNAQGQLGPSHGPTQSSSGSTSSAQHAKLWSLPSELRLSGIRVVEASCGGMHSLLRSSEGLVYSFGEGRNGRLGQGDAKACATPTLIPTFSSSRAATSICAAWAHSVAVDARGGVWTWGHGGSGRLGHGNTLDAWRPRRVDALHRRRLCVVGASSAYEHTGICCSDGSVWMWGLGEHGQLGTGNTETHWQPVLLQSLATAQVKVVQVSCGGAHSAAVSDGGLLLTWGRGDWGQLGHRNRAGRLFGKVVHELVGSRVVSVACGWGCTLAVTTAHDAAECVISLHSMPEVGEILGSGDFGGRQHGLADDGCGSAGGMVGAANVGAAAAGGAPADIAAELNRLHLAGLESSASSASNHLPPEGCPPDIGAAARARGQREHGLNAAASGEGAGASRRAAAHNEELVVTITGTRAIDGTRYYEMAVRHGSATWTIERRYRQFRQLHLALLRLHPRRPRAPAAAVAASPEKAGSAPLPSFPPRVLHLKYAGAGAASDAEARLQALQTYLDGVAALPGIHLNKAVDAFFDLSAWQRAAAQALAAGFVKAAAGMGLSRLWSPRQQGPAAGRWLGGWACEGADRARAQDRLSPRGCENEARSASASPGRGWRLSDPDLTHELHAAPLEQGGIYGGHHAVAEGAVAEVGSPGGRGDRPGGDEVVVGTPRGCEEEAGPVHTDSTMWKSYAYWVQEVAPQWELTLNLSPKKKQAMSLVTSEGMSALARGTLWPLCIGNKLQLNRDLFRILKSKARSARRPSSAHLCEMPPLFGLEQSAGLIETDLGRTMAHLALFDGAGPYALELRDILEAYCFYRPDVGYVQGMSFAAAMLVMHCLDDFTAFSCFANVVSRPFFQCFFRHQDEFKAWCLQERLSIFNSILFANLPALHRHLVHNDVGAEIYVRAWLMTLFAKQLPLPLAARVWDLYLMQGEGLLYRTAVAILRLLETRMLQMPQDELLQLLLSDLAAVLAEEGVCLKLFEVIEATRLPNRASAALDKLLAREAVHEFKSSQLTVGL